MLRKLKLSAFGLLLVAALCACETLPAAKKPVQVEPPKLPPAPANVMVVREPNFLQRLRTFFSASPEKPTK